MERNLDGCYFRVPREGTYKTLCFSDLTDQERESVCRGRSEEWLKSLAFHLADSLKAIGDQFDIVADH